MGKNKLGTIVKLFGKEAGFVGQYTNHSWKVTCDTTLFKENTDEQLIKRQTSHRSDAVRAYKRPCSSHKVAVLEALQQPSMKQPATNLESSALLKTKAGGMPVFNFNITFNMNKDWDWLISPTWTAANSIAITLLCCACLSKFSYYLCSVIVWWS